MKKTFKTVIAVILAIIIVGAVIGGWLIYDYRNSYIGKREALNIALADAQVDQRTVKDSDIDFEHTKYFSYYDVEFETVTGGDYDYTVDASTGEILAKDVKGIK